MCLLLFRSFSACVHPASCSLSASGFPSFLCSVPLSQSDLPVGKMAAHKGPTGLCVSHRAERRPTAHGRTSVHPLWRMSAYPRVEENSGDLVQGQGTLQPELKEGNTVSRRNELSGSLV